MECFIFFIYTIAQLKAKEVENGIVLEKIVSVDHFISNLAVFLVIVCTALRATGMYSVVHHSSCKLMGFFLCSSENRGTFLIKFQFWRLWNRFTNMF